MALYLLLKAVVTKTITVPQYTRADGTIVPAHQKTVHYDPDHTQEDVINGRGTHSQRLAHEQLKKHKDWDKWSDDEKEAHVRAHGMDIHKKRMQADAVSRFKAAFGKEGKMPQSGHYLAFLNESPEKQEKILDGLKKKHGETHVHNIMDKLHERSVKNGDKQPEKTAEQPKQAEQKPQQKPEAKPVQKPEKQPEQEAPKAEQKSTGPSLKDAYGMLTDEEKQMLNSDVNADAVFRANIGKTDILEKMKALSERPIKKISSQAERKARSNESKALSLAHKVTLAHSQKQPEQPVEQPKKVEQKPQEKPAEQPVQKPEKQPEQPKEKADTGPKEGDTKVKNGVTYVLQGGRWRRADKGEKKADKPKAQKEVTIPFYKDPRVNNPSYKRALQVLRDGAGSVRQRQEVQAVVDNVHAELKRVMAEEGSKSETDRKIEDVEIQIRSYEGIIQYAEKHTTPDTQAMAEDAKKKIPALKKQLEELKGQKAGKKPSGPTPESRFAERVQKTKEETMKRLSPGIADYFGDVFDKVLSGEKGADYVSAMRYNARIEEDRARAKARAISYNNHLGGENERKSWENIADDYSKGIDGLNELERHIELKENEIASSVKNEPLDQMLSRKITTSRSGMSFEDYFKEMGVDLKRPDVKKLFNEMKEKRYKSLASYHQLIPNEDGLGSRSKPWAAWTNDEGYSSMHERINGNLGIKWQSENRKLHSGTTYTVESALRAMAERDAYKQVLDRAHEVMKIIEKDLTKPVEDFKQRAKTVTLKNVAQLMNDISDEIADVRRKIGYSSTNELGKKVLTEKKLEPLEKLYSRLSRKRF